MTTYLSGGWYDGGADKKLRTEVLDGAIDAAGVLHRAGVSAEAVAQLALKVRSQMSLGGPLAGNAFDDNRRAVIARRLEPWLGESLALQGFVADCLDNVSSTADLMAFYLHLLHVTRMMQLLAMAQLSPTDGGMLERAVKSASPKKASAKKSSAKKAAQKTKAKKAKVTKKPAKKAIAAKSAGKKKVAKKKTPARKQKAAKKKPGKKRR